LADAGIPSPWDGGVYNHLETHCSPTCVILLNFFAQGLSVWA